MVVGDHPPNVVVVYLLVVEAMYFLLSPLELVSSGSLVVGVGLVVLGWWWSAYGVVAVFVAVDHHPPPVLVVVVLYPMVVGAW